MTSHINNLVLPKYYIIEPTNRCNFRCPICPNSFYVNEVGHMDMELLDSILRQISQFAEVIQLYWLGEPLLDSNIFERIRLCKEKTKAKVIISTNGSLLTKETIVELRDNGLDEIIVSVDACDSEEIYNRIRVGGCLKKLNKRIELLLMNSGNMQVVLQFIDMYINKSEKALFCKKWENYCTEISCLYTWSNQIPSLSLASDNLCPVKNKPRVPCADLWNKMAIRWNGRVSACCFDYSDKLYIGNCSEDMLIDIWNGNLVNQLREDHLNHAYRGMCKECDAWAVPDEYDEMYHIEKG